LSVNKLYFELHHDTFQELYNPNFDTPLQNLRGNKIDVRFSTNKKSNVCIEHQLIASLPYSHACIFFTIHNSGFKYLHKNTEIRIMLKYFVTRKFSTPVVCIHHSRNQRLCIRSL